RGGAGSGGEVAEAALRLTPSREVGERHRRGLAAAHAHRASGEWTRARKIASDLLKQSGLGELRADALLLLGELESLDRAVALLDQALRQATPRPALQALTPCRPAWAGRVQHALVGARSRAPASLPPPPPPTSPTPP